MVNNCKQYILVVFLIIAFSFCEKENSDKLVIKEIDNGVCEYNEIFPKSNYYLIRSNFTCYYDKEDNLIIENIRDRPIAKIVSFQIIDYEKDILKLDWIIGGNDLERWGEKSKIRYGEKLEGMKEEHKTTGLKRGEKYRLFIYFPQLYYGLVEIFEVTYDPKN